MTMHTRCLGVAAAILLLATPALAQVPVAWGPGPETEFHTFSIVAVDLRTGETGTIVTTRNPCVGNSVPWVRAGVGAVATQGGTRVEYGPELLDLMAQGVSPKDALDRVVAADAGRESRQVGVIGKDGRSAQWTGKAQYGAEKRGDWVWMRSGATWAVQGNALVSTKVVDAVADTFQASEGSYRHLADRLIEALNAGQMIGGDGRHGETQSAAVLVADPRPGMSRRPDGQTVSIHVCEHPEPVGELRRIYDTAGEVLGFRRLEQFMGRDIIQLKMMLHALGHFRPNEPELVLTGPEANIYTAEAVVALDRFRSSEEWGTTVPGYVDARVVARLWSRLEEAGRADEIRKKLMEPRRR